MAEYKQYVNLDPSKPDEINEIKSRRTGTYIMLVAKLNKKVEGVPIIFDIKPGTNNIDKRKIRKRRVTDKSGNAKLLFQVSKNGGDEWTFEAFIKRKSGKKGKVLVSDKYIVWRRIYYQISRFKSGPRGRGRTDPTPLWEIPNFDWTPIKNEFKDRHHNIELIDDSSIDLITRRCNILMSDEDYKKSAREGYNSKREPVCMRVVLVNMIAEKGAFNYFFGTVVENKPIIKDIGRYLWIDESNEIKKDFLISAEWRYYSGSDTSWKPLDPKYIDSVGSHRIRINNQNIPKKWFLDIFGERKAMIRLKLNVLKSSTNGVSWYNSIWIAHENMHKGLRPISQKQATTVHETGHFIGMVPAGQSTHYTGHGHQGSHCSTGLSTVDKTKSTYKGLSGTCVMFGEGGSGSSRKNNFCNKCDPSVRTRSVIISKMPTNW